MKKLNGNTANEKMYVNNTEAIRLYSEGVTLYCEVMSEESNKSIAFTFHISKEHNIKNIDKFITDINESMNCKWYYIKI